MLAKFFELKENIRERLCMQKKKLFGPFAELCIPEMQKILQIFYFYLAKVSAPMVI